ncbi:hypothetical protein CcI49_11610 [Frankia sp. CcI49]|nr:hypothetical protein CcI49_11610 [Frankia sp. CcI49]
MFAAGCGGSDPATGRDPDPPGASLLARRLDPSASPDPAPSPDPVSVVRAEVTAAQEKYFTSFLSALADPQDHARVDALLASYTLTAEPRADVVQWLANLADRAFAGRSGPGTYYVIEKITVPPGTVDIAVATVCGYDDGVLFDARQRAPDGSEIIVNDLLLSERTDFTWVRRDVWQIDSVRTTDTWKGRNGCPPREPS